MKIIVDDCKIINFDAYSFTTRKNNKLIFFLPTVGMEDIVVRFQTSKEATEAFNRITHSLYLDTKVIHVYTDLED